MTKQEFIHEVTNRSGVEMSKKDAQTVLETAFDVITRTAKAEGKMSWPGFGTFSLQKRAARKGRNPQTGETIKIKASQTITFKASTTLKAGLQK